MKNTLINKKATIKIAKALGALNKDAVFVGGAMISLYIDDPAAEDIRPTKDIDLSFEITTPGKLERLRAELNEKGFVEAGDEKVICRFKFEDLLVDVMSTDEVGWAPANRWFKPGFSRSFEMKLDDVNIKLLPLPYFLASKFDAFFDRGIKDLYASSDLEDIVYLLNHTSNIVHQTASSEHAVRQYLRDCLVKIKGDRNIISAMQGHLYSENSDERFEMIQSKMNTIIERNS